MDQATSTAMLVLAGTIVGAAASLVGAVIAARTSSSNETRRLAIEAGFREWESTTRRTEEHGGIIFPPALFVYYHIELLRLIERDNLSPAAYHALANRRDALRAAIVEDDKRTKQRRREERQR